MCSIKIFTINGAPSRDPSNIQPLYTFLFNRLDHSPSISVQQSRATVNCKDDSLPVRRGVVALALYRRSSCTPNGLVVTFAT